MEVNNERMVEIIKKIESFDNGIEWDNDNDCWSLEDETYEMIHELIKYIKTTIK